MQKRKIISSRQAEIDIENMANYILFKLCNIQAAIKFKTLINNTIQILSLSPRLGTVYRDNIYIFKLKKYSILYLFTNNFIKILRVFHNRQNISKQF